MLRYRVIRIQKPQGYVGESAKVEDRIKEKDKKEGNGGGARWRERERQAYVVYSLRGSMLVVSDTTVNEARVGFLSHPKTMCRSPHNRVFAFGPSSSFTVPCPAAPSAFGLYRFSASDIVCPRPQHWLFLRAKARPPFPPGDPSTVSVVKKTRDTL